MGYTSEFNIELLRSPESTKEQFTEDKNKLYKDSKQEFEKQKELRAYNIMDFFYLLEEPKQDLKWYDVEKDMVGLSTQYPHIIFQIHQIGEEDALEDSVMYFFLNGTYYIDSLQVIYPTFNIDKLK